MATNLPFTGKFKVTNEYRKPSKRYISGFHTGIDLVGANATVYSVCDGIVIMADNSYGEYGKAVKVMDSITGRIFLFAHLKSIDVVKNQKVSRLSKIGIMGNTGNSSGTHLHIEMRTKKDKYGEVEDIANYMGIPNKEGQYDSKEFQIVDKPRITYEVHGENYGWSQGLKEDGQEAGTTGQSLRIEAIRIDADIPIEYAGHVELIGDIPFVKNGEILGTIGQGKRLESLTIKCQSHKIKASAHVEGYGWLDPVEGNEVTIGTKGRALRLEALTLEFI